MVGAGPAGLAPLILAARNGTLAELAARGLTVLEASGSPGAGALADYAIGSDTFAETFLECLKDGAEPRLAALRTHPTAIGLADCRGGGAPLSAVAAFLTVLGRTMHDILLSHGVRVLTRHVARCSRRMPDGHWCTEVADLAGGPDADRLAVRSARLVLATGAEQRIEDIASERICGRLLLDAVGSRIMLSGEALGHGGADRIAGRLKHQRTPRLAIIGGSHSALACANLVLRGLPGIGLGDGAVSLLHRRPLRIFYPDIEAARADGYHDFDGDDVCPLTGRLYRLAGFRLEARDLARRALGVGDAVADPRLRLYRLGGDEPEAAAWRILDEADLVIPAFGYRPRALRLLDSHGEEIGLGAWTGRGAPLVDRRCRVVDQWSRPVPGVLALGLAAGFVPGGSLGGEPSFVGQTNGLWLWQNDIGAIILDSLLERKTDHVAA